MTLKSVSAAVITILLAACSGSEVARDANTPSQTSNVAAVTYTAAQTILDAHCTQCHGAERSEAGLRLDSWKSIFAGSQHGEVVIPYDADNSLLVEMPYQLNRGPHPVNVGDERLTREELSTLREWIDAGAPSRSGEIPFADATQLVYVCNQGEAVISVIDTETNVVVRNVDLTELGFPNTAKPHHVAVEPGGEHWYVSLIGANAVLKFNRRNELLAKAEFEVPGMLVFDSSSGLLYVGRSMSAVNPPQRIGVIRTSDMSVDEIDVFVPRPHALAVSNDGDHIYTASLAQNTVVTVDAESLQPTLKDLGGPVQTLVQFAVAPDGRTMSAGGQLSGQYHFFDLNDTPDVRIVASLEVGAEPWHPAYSPDGRYVYVPNKGANTITVIDASSTSIVKVISGNGLSQPHGSAVSPDGRYVYVSNNNMKGAYSPRHDLGNNDMDGTLVVVDTRTNDIVKVLELGKSPTGVGAVSGR